VVYRVIRYGEYIQGPLDFTSFWAKGLEMVWPRVARGITQKKSLL